MKSLEHDEQVKFIKDILLSTKREGMDELVEFMEEIGFFTAPASGGNHMCKDGGLLEHTVNVVQYAEKIGELFLGKAYYKLIRDHVVIAAALHDLGKCGRFGKPYYIENMVQDGKPTKANPEQKYKRSAAKPFKINPNLCHIDHPLRSVELATKFIDLTEEETHAIFYHDGAYGSLAYDLKGHEEIVQIIVHFADFWSAQFVEPGTVEDMKKELKGDK